MLKSILDLQYGRSTQSCARIRQDESNQAFSIIVVGGFNNGGVSLSTVEILDDSSSAWRFGPGNCFSTVLLLTQYFSTVCSETQVRR